MKKYVYKGNTPDVEVHGVGIVKRNEPFETDLEIVNPDFEEVSKSETKRTESLKEDK